MSKTQCLSLAMRKMEKNFTAHVDKGYLRRPYLGYNSAFWLNRLDDELEELSEAHAKGDIDAMKDEIADISNLCDYLFERLTLREQGLYDG